MARLSKRTESKFLACVGANDTLSVAQEEARHFRSEQRHELALALEKLRHIVVKG